MVSINLRIHVNGHYPPNKLLFYEIYTRTKLLPSVFFTLLLMSYFLLFNCKKKCFVLISSGRFNVAEVYVEIKL